MESVEVRRFKVHPLVLAVFFGGLLLLSIGAGLVFFKGQNSGDDVKIISAGLQVAGEKITGEIMVHVDGAVARPGVYKLADEARVDDAIKAAGGMTTEADMKSVNLAAKVADGQKIYIQSVGGSVSQSIGGGASSGTVNQNTRESVSINSGTQAELESLPGIGPVTAQKIMSLRPYGSIEELLSKKAVNNSVYQKIKDLVSI